jgi:hypothetical protein
MASRIARARALKADSALWIDKKRGFSCGQNADLPVMIILASQDIDVKSYAGGHRKGVENMRDHFGG